MMCRAKIMVSGVRLENFLRFLVQKIQIKIVCRVKRGKILKKIVLFMCQKV